MGIIEKVERFVTRDGKVHTTVETAESWDDQMDRAEKATALWMTGMNLSIVLMKCFETECPESLKMLTKDTLIAVRYWQCIDQPVYKVTRFMPGGGVHVYGIGDRYRSAYGNPMSLRELERHYDETLKRGA